MDKNSFISRFKVEIHESGCWNWTMALTHKGYGRAFLNGEQWRAHRLSYSLFIGPIPDGLQVCHRCDNPRCSNPEHLFVSDQLGNMRDMITKGRKVFKQGEVHHSAKLTDAQVLAIRSDSRANRLIAADYGIHKSYVNVIRRNKDRRLMRA